MSLWYMADSGCGTTGNGNGTYVGTNGLRIAVSSGNPVKTLYQTGKFTPNCTAIVWDPVAPQNQNLHALGVVEGAWCKAWTVGCESPPPPYGLTLGFFQTFGDNMVLQRAPAKAAVYGVCESPSRTVTDFDNKTVSPKYLHSPGPPRPDCRWPGNSAQKRENNRDSRTHGWWPWTIHGRRGSKHCTSGAGQPRLSALHFCMVPRPPLFPCANLRFLTCLSYCLALRIHTCLDAACTECPGPYSTWKALLNPTTAGGSYTIIVNCTSGCGGDPKYWGASITNVTFGDVWHCSGQVSGSFS